MSVRLSLVVSGVLGLVACAADRSGLGLSDGGGFDGQFDGGFECPEGTFDLDGDGRCECTFSSDVESCDGIDNDCDLSTPDGASDPTVGLPCDGDDLDRCEDGAFVCAVAGYACEEPTDNDTELCDGVEDDDCDGVIDEGCSCTGDDTRSCGTDEGECTRGLQRCVDGVYSACDGVGPADDVCNALDDDCDGRTDEALDAGCWVDGDSDTYATAGAASTCLPAGGCPGGFTTRRPVSGMQDCNDAAMGINPGASEICDLVDQDCDGRTDEGLTLGCWNDGDGDGFPPMNAPGRCVPVVGGCPSGTTTRNPGMAANRDCNDSNPAVRPDAMEICNGVDDNCAGGIDNGLPNGCWNDGDGDGYAPMGAAGRCQPTSGTCPSGTTDREPSGASNIDCNDGNGNIRPGQPEVCNGIDDNCAGGTDEGIAPGCWADGDGDTFAPNGAASQCRPSTGCPSGTTMTNPSGPATRDCNDGNPSIRPGAMETCNNVNDDCDSNTDEGVTQTCSTACGSGIETCTAGTFGGCTARMPMAEVCNGMDDDCVGGVDNGVSFGCWADPDGDGFAAVGAAGQCEPGSGCPPGTTDVEPVGADQDCRGNDPDSYPGADELCDGVDNDCNGSIDGECGADCEGRINGTRLYVFCDNANRTYNEAKSRCGMIGDDVESAGMTLASLTSDAEGAFVSGAALAISNSEWWIGLYRTSGPSGAWTWEDGSPAPQDSMAAALHNEWVVGEPNGSGDCARMTNTGEWADIACNEDRRYICEGPAP